jgi:AcrR family transcriptional regulator
MSVNLIVAEAGVAKGTFFHHFGDRAGFLLAIHAGFHDLLAAEIGEAVDQLPPGRERLLGMANGYLNGCLRHRGVRSLLLEARAEPAIAQAVLERNEWNTRLFRPDFEAMGWQHPGECGRIWNGLVVEAALAELPAGRRKPGIRAALAQFIDRT